MAVGEAVLEGLIAVVVDAEEIFGHIAVTPVVAGDSGGIAVEGIAPFCGGVAAAFNGEFHGRDVGGRSVGVEDNIQQVGLGQLRSDGTGSAVEVLCVIGGEGVVVDARQHDAAVDAVLDAGGLAAALHAGVAAEAEETGSVFGEDEVLAVDADFVFQLAVDIDSCLFSILVPNAHHVVIYPGLGDNVAGGPLPGAV